MQPVCADDTNIIIIKTNKLINILGSWIIFKKKREDLLWYQEYSLTTP